MKLVLCKECDQVSRIPITKPKVYWSCSCGGHTRFRYSIRLDKIILIGPCLLIDIPDDIVKRYFVKEPNELIMKREKEIPVVRAGIRWG